MKALLPEDLNALESRLRAERRELLDRIRIQLHASKNPELLALANHLNELGDWSVTDLPADIDIAMLGQELSGLRDIDEALKRIATGDYGICSDCGKAISADRLQAHPATRLCLSCKQSFERRRGIVSGR